MLTVMRDGMTKYCYEQSKPDTCPAYLLYIQS